MDSDKQNPNAVIAIEPPDTQPSFSKQAVVKLGDGRGFIVGSEKGRYVVTAAHCLPRSRYPSPHLANGVNELTFPRIMGPIGSKRSTIWAELCALSLADDVAVFTEPDGQELWDQNGEYEQFTETAMPVGEPPPIVPPYEWDSVAGTPGWMLSLDCSWLPCTVYNNGRFLTTRGVKIKSGMSGSPILNSAGHAIGLISTSGGDDVSNMHPCLMACIPQWLSNLIAEPAW